MYEKWDGISHTFEFQAGQREGAGDITHLVSAAEPEQVAFQEVVQALERANVSFRKSPL